MKAPTVLRQAVRPPDFTGNARTNWEWLSRYAQPLPPRAGHQRDGERCLLCGGWWPCQARRGER